ncbi:alkene reductase [Lacinutrix sp. Hel_I_90]|uniref:alkene reductase n=1 Tax=Lacinutrix sp. Hel_I_90 TaxID=1249999 RepID=UPI0005CB6F9D|nr:alkene reductase [Lacinutrix sp. Hel_I_90]
MKLFEPFDLKNKKLKNRIVMAPMTRSRAVDNIPNALMANYYRQRAGAGLIISEGTSPSVNGLGYPRIPGAYSPAQIEGWKAIADAIHEKGSVFFLQLMHCGRVTSSENLPEMGETIAPSAVKAAGEMMTDTKGLVAHETPKKMTHEDIEATQQEYVNCAQNLIRVGVDGVELHSANGYLMEQFLNPKSNLRTDDYGGNFKNRARFVIETVKKVVAAIGAENVGIRFSPYGEMNDMQSDYDDLVSLYVYLATELKALGIAYIHIVDHRGEMGAPQFKTDIKETIKGAFAGTVITGGEIDSKEKAQEVLAHGFDLAYIGRSFISNPDLVEKLKHGKALTKPKEALFYTSGAEGYTDY